MTYIVTTRFHDKQNSMYTYEVDAEYPVKGYEPTPERIEQLVNGGFIREVTERTEPEPTKPPADFPPPQVGAY